MFTLNNVEMSLKQTKLYVYLYHNFYKPSKFPSMEHIIDLFSKNKKDVFFVQVGANEGHTGDPLYRHIRLKGWKGILIEPQKEVFKQLVKNHKHNPGLIFENVAISNDSEPKEFFFIEKTPDLPDFVTKLSSFERRVTEDVLTKFPNAKVKSVKIPCTTIQELVKKHQVNKVNLMLLDTEGFDYEILKTVDLKALDMDMIVFEHRHLNAADQNEAIRTFKKLGYSVFKDEYDTIAFKNDELAAAYKDYLV